MQLTILSNLFIYLDKSCSFIPFIIYNTSAVKLHAFEIDISIVCWSQS